jgi:hypothetical protein
LRVALAAAALVATACPAPPDGTVTPEEVTPQNFCAKYVPARIESADGCYGGLMTAIGPGFGAGARDTCAATVKAREKALAAGRVAFDADAARACLNTTRTWDCQFPPADLSTGLMECDFDAIFPGAAAPGAACFNAGECDAAKGWCDKASPSACAGQCVAWVGLTSACQVRDFQHDKPDTCDPALGFCGRNTLKCLAWSADEVTGGCGSTEKRCNPLTQTCGLDKVCRPILKKGEVCKSTSSCPAGLACIAGICASPGEEGTLCARGGTHPPCQPDLACFPPAAGGSNVCSGRLSAELPCAAHPDCETGLVCRFPAGATVGACKPPQREGMDCTPPQGGAGPGDCVAGEELCDGDVCRVELFDCDATTSKCKRRPRLSEPCVPSADRCQPGIWCKPPESGAAVCAALPKLNEGCDTGRGCSEGWCAQSTTGTFFCAGLLDTNGSCDDPSQCKSGRCIENKCAVACAG